ncbi:MAG: 9-O-acetylesterase [Planctomycetes bacterium]|nr:9-O-acetylesterase [Planctomycetota bacterium]
MRTPLLLCLLVGGLCGQDQPKAFRPKHLFGDHMVLPPLTAVPISGFGPAGAAVEVQGSWGERAHTITPADGRWQVTLKTPERGGPVEVTLRCTPGPGAPLTTVLRDVLIGDVWLASGQSNMEMPVGEHGGWRGGVLDFEEEIATADHPQLRMFTVERTTSGVPLDDVEGQWQVCSPATVATFSASAYFFGRELLARGKGPIGLVVSSWGGTVCEAWTSAQGLRGFPEFEAALAATRPGTAATTVASRRAAFWKAVPDAPADVAATSVQMPDLWSRSGLGDFDGVAFYRHTVALPAALRGKELWLDLGTIDDMDTVWCNGARVDGMERDGVWSTPRHYRVPAALTAGKDSVALLVRVVDTGGEGGFSGAAADLQLRGDDGAPRVALDGAWQRFTGPTMRELPKWPRDDNGPNRPAVLYNAMIAPLVPFPFTGAIWYQGESNRGRAEQYARLFPAMIEDWRAAFQRPLPFYFVQIAPFDYDRDELAAPRLRDAQAAALRLPHTGMVVTLDVGEARDIHPKNKQAVGLRLALQALRDHYGEQIVADGPRPRRITQQGDAVRVVFDNADGGLVSDGPPRGFELAGADGVFHGASARLDGDAVLLRCAAVPSPTHVRYGWAAVPDCSLGNGAGLPAWPFSESIR